MIKKIIKGIRKIYNYIYCKLDPVKYAKYIGVNVGNNVHIYGGNPDMFSTEPWIITIGDNVHKLPKLN